MSAEDGDQLDIEVGRYALRTFQITPDGKLCSLYKPYTWEGGKAIATCMSPAKHEEVPNLECHCGIYGTITIEHLVRHYLSVGANKSVAVFAAEGLSYIGSRGLRTKAARIVAYWAIDAYKAYYAKECPGAKGYDDINEMLEAYKFAKHEGEWPPPVPEPVRRPFGYGGGYIGGGGSGGITSTGGATVMPGSGYRLGTYAMHISKLMTQASPAGVAAVQALMEGKVNGGT